MTYMRAKAGLAAIALTAMTSGAAHAEIFLSIPQVRGDSAQRGFEQQIALSGATLSVSSYETPDPSGSGALVRTPAMAPIMISKKLDRASPRLMAAARTGQQLGQIEIAFTAPIRPGAEPFVEGRWIVEGAAVTSYSLYPSGEPGVQVENVEISYARIRYQHYSRDNGRAGAMEEVTLEAPETVFYGYEGGCGG